MEITVVLTNKTPIFSAAPGASTISIDGHIGVPHGFPFTRQRTLRVPARDESGVVKTVPLPLVPSNTMRNLLRRSALESIMERFERDGETLDVAAYAAAYSGSASGNPEGVPASFDETYSVRQHPFLGLFGGGPRMIAGRLRVDSMYPVTWAAKRLLGDGYEDMEVNDKLLDVVWVRRCDPIEKNPPEQLQSRVTDARQSITEWSLAGIDQKEKRKKTKTEEEPSQEKIGRGLNAFNAHEVVIPGLNWVWKVRLDNPTREQVGLVLSSIMNIADKEMAVAGGHAKDYGQVGIETITGDGENLFEAGAPTDQAEQFLDAFAEALDRITPEDFQSFVKPGKPGKAAS